MTRPGAKEAAEKKGKKRRGLKPPSHLERITVTMSLFVLVCAVMIFPSMDKGSDSYYVMWLTVLLNLLLLGWILFRNIRSRRKARKQKGKQKGEESAALPEPDRAANGSDDLHPEG